MMNGKSIFSAITITTLCLIFSGCAINSDDDSDDLANKYTCDADYFVYYTIISPVLFAECGHTGPIEISFDTVTGQWSATKWGWDSYYVNSASDAGCTTGSSSMDHYAGSGTYDSDAGTFSGSFAPSGMGNINLAGTFDGKTYTMRGDTSAFNTTYQVDVQLQFVSFGTCTAT